MAVIKRLDLAQKLKQIATEEGPRIFLFVGERYLCRKGADELIAALLQQREGNVCVIDGDQEDGSQTLVKLMSFSLLPGLQIYRINDTRLFHSKNISQTVWQRATHAFKANQPQRAVKYLADMYHLAAIPTEERQPLTEMTSDQWQSLFGLAKPSDLGWTTSLYEQLQQQVKSSPLELDLPDKYIDNLKKGMPPNNLLILTAESVDKRKRLYTYLKKNGLIVDCSVAEGSSASAQKVQKSVLQEIMQHTLQQYHKTIEPGALEIFLERVGFHPVAVAMETEKLALFVGDQQKITLKDLNQMVGRSREDALFELTDNIGKKQLGKSLTTLHHLLENGVHGLAILATLRNYLRKLLIFRSLQLQSTPPYSKTMAARQFQEDYLPKLKQNSKWSEFLGGHPYALYMGFTQAAEFNCSTLKYLLEQILIAEFRMKGSGLAESLILEHLMLAIFKKKRSTL